MAKLDKTFYLQDDVVSLARQLVGKVLYTNINDQITGGIINETEAYHENEKACHSHAGKKTTRTEVLFYEGGCAYVYLCYGIHLLFNIVTGPMDSAQAVLVRSIVPLKGIPVMEARRKMLRSKKNFSAGPGTLTQTLGINKNLNKADLLGNIIWIEDKAITFKKHKIEVSPRIGIDYAEEDALLPWRFFLEPKHIILK